MWRPAQPNDVDEIVAMCRELNREHQARELYAELGFRPVENSVLRLRT